MRCCAQCSAPRAPGLWPRDMLSPCSGRLLVLPFPFPAAVFSLGAMSPREGPDLPLGVGPCLALPQSPPWTRCSWTESAHVAYMSPLGLSTAAGLCEGAGPLLAPQRSWRGAPGCPARLHITLSGEACSLMLPGRGLELLSAVGGQGLSWGLNRGGSAVGTVKGQVPVSQPARHSTCFSGASVWLCPVSAGLDLLPGLSCWALCSWEKPRACALLAAAPFPGSATRFPIADAGTALLSGFS